MAIAGTTTVEGAVDLSAETIYRYFRGHAYTDAIERRIAAAYVEHTRAAGLRTSGVVGQSGVETGRHTYGNQVKAGQYNFAGLGATDDGAAGASFDTPEDGVKAHIAHWGNYLYGPFSAWPERMRPYQPYAFRNKQVLALMGNKRISTFGELGSGVWGTDSPYWPKVITQANVLLAAEGTMNGKQRTDHMIATLRARGVEVIDRRGLNPVNKAHPYGQVSGGIAGVKVYVQHWTGDGFNRATIKQITGTDYGLDRISELMTVADEIDLVNWYANYHISLDGRTWGGIAYGILVFPSGRVYVNWDIGTLTYHAFSVNGYSYAICTPSAQSQPPTPIQLVSLNHVWQYLCEETPEAPAGWSDLWGHTECKRFDAQNQTSCPGTALVAQVQKARATQAPTVDLSATIPQPPPAPATQGENPSALKVEVPGRGEFWIVEPILSFWRASGGIFDHKNAPGYPVTGMYEEGGALIQWFDRARIEARGEEVSSALVGLEGARQAGKAA